MLRASVTTPVRWPCVTSFVVCGLASGCAPLVDADAFRRPFGEDGGTLSLRPERVDEGMGTSAGPPAVVVLTGVGGATEARVLGPGAELLAARASEDGDRLGLALRVPVDRALDEGAAKTVDIEVVGRGRVTLRIEGHDEGVLEGDIDRATLEGRRFSTLEVRSARFFGEGPVKLRALGAAALGGPEIDASARDRTPGPGGCAPDEACPAAGAPGQDGSRGGGGGGGGGFAGAGMAGAGRGGDGGPRADLAAGAGARGGASGDDPGGDGGAGGGVLLIDAGGGLRGAARLDVSGADGAASRDCAGGGGGGGGGGAIVLASASDLSGLSGARETSGGGGGGGAGCGMRGGAGGPGAAYALGPGGSGPRIVTSAFDDPRIELAGPAGATVALRAGASPPRTLTLDETGRAALRLDATAEVCLLAPVTGDEVSCLTRFVP